MEKNKRVMSVDWLQLFGGFASGVPDFELIEYLGFIVEHQSKGTKQFRKWTKVLEKETGMMFFEVCYDPYSIRGGDEGGIYRPNAGTLRVDNRVCYSKVLFDLVKDAAAMAGFYCTSISRIDLCMDMHVLIMGCVLRT